MRPLILASTSPYRKEQLATLRLPFECYAPNIDEAAKPGELPEQLARRLSLEKAQKVAKSHPDALVIGSDQVACIDGQILTKPGSHLRAKQQLAQQSGHCVTFFSGVAVIHSLSGREQAAVVATHVHFRELTAEEIERYLQIDQPYQCAGSFKAESLGISLFREVTSTDPSALIGLPLITLAEMLRNEGVEI